MGITFLIYIGKVFAAFIYRGQFSYSTTDIPATPCSTQML